jgi:hypothetical protein
MRGGLVSVHRLFLACHDVCSLVLCVAALETATMHFLSILPLPPPCRNPIPRRGIFQPLEKYFPIIGKPAKIFSNHWKTAENFFQSLENPARFFQPLETFFPIIGKLFRPPRARRAKRG